MDNEKEIDRLFQSYRDYSSNLRAWFVGYGIGLTVYILGNRSIHEAIGSRFWLAALLFVVVIGIASQIRLSLTNKRINWYCYKAQSDKIFREANKSMVEKSEKLIDEFSIDRRHDGVTIFCFSITTLIVLLIIFTS